MSADEKIDGVRENQGGEETSKEVTLALATEDATHAAARPTSETRELGSTRPSAGELFERYLTFVWRVIAAHGVREADVADLTQDVFVVAFQRLDTWEPARASVTSWLYGIAARVAANHRRKAHVRKEAPADAAPSARTRSDAALERVLLAELGDALLELDQDKRDAFILFEVAELSMHEVAVTLGCPLKTAYKRLYAARRAISEKLGDQGRVR
jgi:RNA polymerase sigma-70 factor, ECF subfamily